MTEIIGFELINLTNVINSVFGKKSKSVADMNIDAAKAGFNFAKENFKERFEHKVHKIKRANDKRILISGNEAVAYGAIASSCRFFAAYPMTPSSSILHTLVDKSSETDMVVKHAQDEINVINITI